MKIILSLLLLLFCKTTFSQTVTYQNLSGDWLSKNTSKFDILVKSDFVFNKDKTVNWKNNKLSYTLSSHSSHTTLHIFGTGSEGEKINVYWYIKIIKHNTLRMQQQPNGEFMEFFRRHIFTAPKITRDVDPPKITKDDETQKPQQ